MASPSSHPGLRHRMPSAKMPSTRFVQGSARHLSSSRMDSIGGGLQNPRAAALGGVRVTEEEADAILQDLANNDDNSKKTWSRLFVENTLQKVSPKRKIRR